MGRRMRQFALLCSASIFTSGCALSGSWRAESTHPPGAPFPINEITFDQGKYTATGLFTPQGEFSGRRRTTTGDYSFNGFTLKLRPGDGPELSYKTARRLNGKLSMTFHLPNQDQSVTAVLAPVKPAS